MLMAHMPLTEGNQIKSEMVEMWQIVCTAQQYRNLVGTYHK